MNEGTAQLAGNVILMGGTVVAAVMGPWILYKLATTPSWLYEREPRTWMWMTSLCVGLTLAGVGMVHVTAERVYKYFSMFYISDLRDMGGVD